MQQRSRAGASYHIVDEPAPAGLDQVIVNPMWPLFASMFAGAWLSYPWFVLNAFALGGRRRFGDLAIALGGLLGSAALVLLTSLLASRSVLDERSLAYVKLLPIGVKLTVVYVLFMRQEQTYGLYTYFGGATRNAALIVIAGAFLRSHVLGPLEPLWQLLLG
jgi:hypothetical protein